MPPPLLSANDLTFGYTERPLCERVGFTLRAGEWGMLSGPNGVGKTSLLRTVCGLLEPLSGEILWSGQPVSFNDARYLSNIVYVGHRAGLSLELTVRENLMFYATLLGIGGDVILPVAQRMGVADILDTLCTHISQGQLRRVALCRLAMGSHPIWLLDEPTAALDRSSMEHLSQMVATHLDDGGCALVATHRDWSIPGHAMREQVELHCCD